MADVLSRRALNRATLARQLLLERAQTSVADAVERLLALQAQQPSAPFLGLWNRLAGFTADDLRTALDRREVVRATYVRATVHLLSARDYLAFRALVEPSLAAAAAAATKRIPGPDADPERLVSVARGVLGAGPLDFGAIRERMQVEFPEVNDRALGYCVRMNLPLVMVPTADRWAFPASSQVAMAESWLGTEPAANSSAEDFVRRYLAAYGPAGPADLREFGWLKTADVFQRLAPELREFTTEDGQVVYDLADAPRPDPDTPAPARLLPEFDSLVLAHKDRSRIVPTEYRPRLITKNLRVPASFLWDGFVAGTWSTTRRRTAVTLTLTPFERLPAQAVRELSAEADRVLRFTDAGIAERDVVVAPVD
ncbi:winged helix DNA-binding domain-containing protein [Streptomyces naphthomycinicus]|uniref:winged helix DNA-binding domain-containing protein n=1 Tax=Streptomyces naphthomycinicus TaxID=2872625 RepID=UPI001CED30F3|nr:winged helix DNA-binding domain-containing protein [Streptomyces sp. TML10]